MTQVIEWLVAEAEAEAASDLLWGLGASAVAELPGSEPGTVLLVADVPDGVEVPAGAAARPVRAEDGGGAPSGTWTVGPFELRTPDRPRSGDGVDVVLDADGAFGAGSHPTTRLALLALAGLGGRAAGARVLDVGSGTGVLGIAAACLGAAVVDAVDVDAVARERTATNAAANGVADRVRVVGASVGDVEGPYDLVLMNVLLPVHLELGPTVAGLLGGDATRILTGLLDTQLPAALAAHGVDPAAVAHHLTDGDWVAAVL